MFNEADICKKDESLDIHKFAFEIMGRISLILSSFRDTQDFFKVNLKSDL